MIFSLIVLKSPEDNDSSRRALRFAQALIDNKHTLLRVFFYADGTLNGHRDSATAIRWAELSTNHCVELILCSTSAQQRGITEEPEDDKQSGKKPSLADNFELSGLGQLLDASLQSDRLVTFA